MQLWLEKHQTLQLWQNKISNIYLLIYNYAVFYVNCSEVSKCSGLNCHMTFRDAEVYNALQVLMYCGKRRNSNSYCTFLNQEVLYIQQGQQ